MRTRTKHKYNCSVCSLVALCVLDAHNVLSCITVCPNCSNVSVPVATDKPVDPGVEYKTLQGVHPSCVDRVMCAGETSDSRYRCPDCGFKKGRSPTGHTAKGIEHAQFMRKVHD